MQPGKSIMDILASPRKESSERIVVYDEYGKTRMIRDRKYKYIHRYGDGECELYDMETDPDETVNLHGKEQFIDVERSLKEEMEIWFDRFTDEKKDARKFDVKGRGQQDLCWKKDAFNTRIEYYYPEKQKK